MADAKEYKVTQIAGKITWQAEELWEGGEIHGPYGTKEAAMQAEERLAQEKGYADSLVLAGTEGEEVSPEQAFEKDEDGSWTCVRACSINMGGKELVFHKGLKFEKDQPFQGVKVAEWLEENLEK